MGAGVLRYGPNKLSRKWISRKLSFSIVSYGHTNSFVDVETHMGRSATRWWCLRWRGRSGHVLLSDDASWGAGELTSSSDNYCGYVHYTEEGLCDCTCDQTSLHSTTFVIGAECFIFYLYPFRNIYLRRQINPPTF